MGGRGGVRGREAETDKTPAYGTVTATETSALGGAVQQATGGRRTPKKIEKTNIRRSAVGPQLISEGLQASKVLDKKVCPKHGRG